MQIAAGSIIAGKYQLERLLACGGMGAVWVARHVLLGSRVAVKVLDPRLAASPAFLERFEREARAAAALQGPHVVHVQDYGVEGDTPYLVMELLQGEDLDARLARTGRLSLQETVRILIQIGKALRKAHEAGIVHRDLKPANLFLTRVDEQEIVKILDFGIAKETLGPVSGATKTGEIMGSPHYMSPEQARGDRGVDHRTDLWALGVILYRCVTGVLPFPGEALGEVLSRILVDPAPSVIAIAKDLPPSLDAFFARALAKVKTDRFQSVREIVDAFSAIASGAPLSDTVPLLAGGPLSGAAASTLTSGSAAGDLRPAPRRSAKPWIVAGALALAVAASAALGWSRMPPSRPARAPEVTAPAPRTAPPPPAPAPPSGAAPAAPEPPPASPPGLPTATAERRGTTADGPAGPTAPRGTTTAPPGTATAAPRAPVVPRSAAPERRPPAPPAPPKKPDSDETWGF